MTPKILNQQTPKQKRNRKPSTITPTALRKTNNNEKIQEITPPANKKKRNDISENNTEPEAEHMQQRDERPKKKSKTTNKTK